MFFKKACCIRLTHLFQYVQKVFFHSMEVLIFQCSNFKLELLNQLKLMNNLVWFDSPCQRWSCQ